jgi:ribosomal protein L37AE/L43A
VGKEQIMKNTVCPKCKKYFCLGVNGTIYGCDKCTGVKRDKGGYAWLPDEQEQIYEPIGGSEKDRFTVTRAQAFGKDAG